jgi:hypothetical protein
METTFLLSQRIPHKLRVRRPFFCRHLQLTVQLRMALFLFLFRLLRKAYTLSLPVIFEHSGELDLKFLFDSGKLRELFATDLFFLPKKHLLSFCHK